MTGLIDWWMDGWMDVWMTVWVDWWMDDRLSFLPLIAVATEVAWLSARCSVYVGKVALRETDLKLVTHREMPGRQVAFYVVLET